MSSSTQARMSNITLQLCRGLLRMALSGELRSTQFGAQRVLSGALFCVLSCGLSCVLCSPAVIAQTLPVPPPPAAQPPQVISTQNIDEAFFEQQIRPLLHAHCVNCHGPDKQKSGLRVDHRSFLLQGGERGPALVPGEMNASRLFTAVSYDDVALQMPPRSRLQASQVEALGRWIAAGAPWPKEEAPQSNLSAETFDLDARRLEHWCWQELREDPIPNLQEIAHSSGRSVDVAWPKQTLDYFVLAKLHAHQLTPAPEVSRERWLRRATVVLTGLPPTPEELSTFLADTRSNAREEVVDRLLSSTSLGEQWARHWLDLMRYAESYGHEFDYRIAHAHEYRDYVIRAFCADVPYADWVTEHIAGDLLETPRRRLTAPHAGANESIIGSGFWYLNQATHAPVDVRLDEAERVENQIDVFSKAFLGLTVACARCHDHKFDAISTADYYALAGYLKGTRRQHAFIDSPAELANNMKLKEAQEAHTQEFRAQLNDAANPKAIEAVLQAVRQVLFGEPRSTDSPLREDRLFADFEGDDFAPWSASGDAFSAGPARATLPRQNKVTGWRGRGYVNSFNDGDKTQGRLSSPAFVIEHRYLHFDIGGGAHRGKTCMILEVEGQEVLMATGRNREQLSPQSWHLDRWQGKEARIVIVDAESGGWGHINVDHLLFSDAPRLGSHKRPISDVAAEYALEPEQLSRAIHFVESSASPWAVALRGEVLSSQREAHEAATPGPAFAPTLAPWSATGTAFSRQHSPAQRLPHKALAPIVSAESPLSLTPWQHLHSGRIGTTLQGVLRSADFTIGARYVHTRVRGAAGSKGVAGELRVIVDGYVMDEFNALLFEQHRRIIKEQPEWRWVTQDLERYRQHRAHIEIKDESAGFIVVSDIVFSDDARPPQRVGEPPHFPDGSLRRGAEFIAEQMRQIAKGTSKNNRPLLNAIESVAPLLQSGFLTLPRAQRLEQLWQQRQILEKQPLTTRRALAATAGTAGDEAIFVRGDHRQLGEVVPRRFLTALGGSNPTSEVRDRRQLAKALFSHPLPYRVWVNRVWQHTFGRGLCETPDNFGVTGKPPTHPALLDALTRHFRDTLNGSTRALLREFVLSSTFAMESVHLDPELQKLAEQKDPNNTLWHRIPVRRLTAENIRDALLATSGHLDPTPFGPSVPVHVTPFMQGRGRPASGPLLGKGRRSIYTSVQRNFLSPFMLAFDFPLPHTSIGRRSVSNVPAQGLVLMNSPLVHELAQLWGKRLAGQTESAVEKIADIYRRAFCRSPSARETAEALRFLKESSASEPELSAAAWGDLCHVIFNLKEFIYLR